MNDFDKYELTSGAKEDLLWNIRFLKKFNGLNSNYSFPVCSYSVTPSRCLFCWRGHSVEKGGLTRFKWPKSVLDWKLSINDLDLFNLLICLRIWGESLRGETVKILCDNNTSVKAMLSGKAKNDFMAACLRELWLIASITDMFLLCEHICGEDNNEADTLSRAFLSPKHWDISTSLVDSLTEKNWEVSTFDFRYPDT